MILNEKQLQQQNTFGISCHYILSSIVLRSVISRDKTVSILNLGLFQHIAEWSDI